LPPSPRPATGIELGLKVFPVTADGREIAPPRDYRQAQAPLRRSQRAAARTQPGSHRRKTAVRRLAKQHRHVANQRRDSHHQVARHPVHRHGMIAHEALNLRGIARTRLATSTHDGGWGRCLAIPRGKAQGAGVRVIAVPPATTTQRGSAGGALPEPPGQRTRLGDRVHRCPSCGEVADRGVNAAQTILRLARSLQASTLPLGGVARGAAALRQRRRHVILSPIPYRLVPL
jgi:putative transposase